MPCNLMRSIRLFCAAALFLSGCLFECPLSDKPSREVDPRALGVWLAKDGETKITVRATDASHYHILFEPRFHETVTVPPMTFEGHHTMIDGVDILNLKAATFDGKPTTRRSWLFGAFKVVDADTIDLEIINEKFVFKTGGEPTQPINTPAGLSAYLRKSISKEGFFTKPQTLKRSAN